MVGASYQEQAGQPAALFVSTNGSSPQLFAAEFQAATGTAPTYHAAAAMAAGQLIQAAFEASCERVPGAQPAFCF